MRKEQIDVVGSGERARISTDANLSSVRESDGALACLPRSVLKLEGPVIGRVNMKSKLQREEREGGSERKKGRGGRETDKDIYMR